MKNRVLSIALVLALVAGMFVSAAPAYASPPGPDYKPYDIGPKLRELDVSDVTLNVEGFEDELSAAGASTEGTTPELYGEGEVITAIWYDDTAGLYLADYEVKAIGEYIEVWVMTDLDFPTGDFRNPVIVTQEQIDYLVDEFDNNIYPTMVEFFGPPDFHDGSNAGLPFGYYDPEGRTIAMISNIGDRSYYDSTYPNYIAGFYWGSVFENYLDRNVISIDAFDWENRVGPDGSRPFLYEGVFAHEYQHLIHDDYDPDEEELINEGLSMFSEYLTNYVIGNDAYSTFEDMPENSLPVWEDQGGREIVADYGNVFLFQMYLYEKFGLEFIKSEFLNQDNGVESINSTLAAYNKQTSFGDLYHDFAVAVLIDSKQANYRYGFEALAVGVDIGTPEEPNPDAYDTPGAPPWGSDYIWLEGDPKDLGKFTFNGVDYGLYPSSWQSKDGELWSGKGDLMDNWLIFPYQGGEVLSFDTYWDIETYWDYGFVQVSIDGGSTWTSLENAYTTYAIAPDAIQTAIDNLPGITGEQPDVINIGFDLPDNGGEEILIAFRYITDWFTSYDGWFIDNVYVDETLISDGTATDGFILSPGLDLAEQDFTVTFVGIKEKSKKDDPIYKVHTMKLSDASEEGLFELNRIMNWADQAVLIVTFDAPYDFSGYADYTYDFTYMNQGPKK